MKTSVELPDDLVREVSAHASLQGRPLVDLVADGLKLLLRQAAMETRPKERGSATEWIQQYAGTVILDPGETSEDARAEHYRMKYGI